jgi:hypothetical protein
MSFPEMIRLAYRMGFLAMEMQLVFAARLWGFTRKVQEEAQALAEPLPVAMPMPTLADAVAKPKPGRAAPGRAAPARAATRRAAAPQAEARVN